MREINIALLGFGTVGKGVYELIQKNQPLFEDAYDFRLVVKKILEKNPKAMEGYPKELFTEDIADITSNENIQIVVEMMGGVNPAADFMMDALKAGKHVVSSNKEALAVKLPDINWEAVSRGLLLRYEAAVCGAIPIMNVVYNSLASNKITKIEGILNGTSNYILTMMGQGLDYETALKQAQEKGFAEADPTKDVHGIDTVNKIVLLAVAAFGEYVAPWNVPVSGITEITPAMIEEAKAEGSVIKLIATAEMDGDTPKLSVAPKAVPKDSPLGRTDYEYNAVTVTGNMAGDIFLQGKGAGKFPTASAVCADILDIAKTFEGEE